VPGTKPTIVWFCGCAGHWPGEAGSASQSPLHHLST
jgi:hypothetical protein